MKITVIKKGTKKAKPSNWCPVMVDMPAAKER